MPPTDVAGKVSGTEGNSGSVKLSYIKSLGPGAAGPNVFRGAAVGAEGPEQE